MDEIDIINGVSDHKMLVLSSQLSKKTSQNTRPEYLVHDFRNADDLSVLDYLEEHFDHFSHLSDVNQLWRKFKNIVSHCICRFVPLRKVRGKPWITRESLQLKRKIKLRRKNKVRNTTEIANLGRQLKDLVTQAKESYCGNVLSRFLRESPQNFWRFFSTPKEEIAQVLINNQVVSCPSAIAEEFNKYFQSVFTVSRDPPVDPVVVPNDSQMPELVLSESGIFNLLLNINDKKASGADNIPNAFLRRYAGWVSRYFYLIFQASLLQSKLPEDWLCGKIVPIYKSGNKMDI